MSEAYGMINKNTSATVHHVRLCLSQNHELWACAQVR